MVGLKTHSINLYKELADDPEYPINYHHADGGIRLANTPEQMDGYRHFASMAKGMGVDFEVIDAEECARRHPLLSTENLLGGLWDPMDGDIDPAQLCQALARRARLAGATVYRNTPVTDLTQHADDSWTVASMEHQYFVTEAIPEIEAATHRMPLLRCPISDYYCRQEKNGLLVGFHGWLLAQQIVHGEACYDTWVIDPRRFTGHANVELTSLKAIEDYQNEFRFHMPHEHRPAGRNAKTTPLTPILAARGAEFGVVNGWERVDYFKPTDDFTETHSFRFNESFDVVGKEIKALQQGVAMTEVNGFNRFEITGDGARDWLDTVVCSRVPRTPGKVGLTYLLNEQGNIKGEATLANLDEDRVWYGSAAASEFHDMDWLNQWLPKDGSVQIRSLTNEWTILVLAGPKSREVLSAVSRGDWSKQAFPWLSVREAFIGIAPAVVMSVSFSGELAYEIHVPNQQLYAAYRARR